MGLSKIFGKVEDLVSEIAARWETELSKRDLDKASIDDQRPSELRDSLERITALVEDPSPLPTLWYDPTERKFDWDLAGAEEAGRILPDSVLLNRREYILSQLQRATDLEKADLSREHAEPSLDDKARELIESELEELAAEDARLERLRNETEERRDMQAFELQIQEANLVAEERRADIAIREKLAAAEAKSQWWQTRLSRDSIAAIVGGVLLIGFATAVIVAMFVDTDITDVVQNSFLLILGYFFGAAIASRPSGETNKVDSSGLG